MTADDFRRDNYPFIINQTKEQTMNIKKSLMRGLALSGASTIMNNASANKELIATALDITNNR